MKLTGTLTLGLAAILTLGMLVHHAPWSTPAASEPTSAANHVTKTANSPGIADEQAAAEEPVEGTEEAQADVTRDVTQGALRFKGDQGLVECPLKHTDVAAAISAFVTRVTVKQTFVNPTDEPIEATYVFPLPHESAVDRMTMVIGDRRIEGTIERRDEARRIYEAALMAGQTAALLEQERPNIFTQSVGNIPPGETVEIEISYVDVLRYDLGEYTFHFPMVVGPRYIPGSPTTSPQPRPEGLQGRVSPPDADTDRVPDASRINPPVLRPEFRTGHDISLTVELQAGVPVQDLQVANHEIVVDRPSAAEATVSIKPADSLPNKDFVLRYRVVGKKPEMALLAHTGSYSRDVSRLGNGYFMLMIQPQEDERLTSHPPREMVFLVDVSGSMRGEPTAKVIDAMREMLKLCRPQDTVQVVTFAGQAHQLFEGPVPVVPQNIDRALSFTGQLQGSGGTEMLEGVKLAIDQPLDEERMRIVVMLTDGYIGNEAEIIQHVGENCGDRIRFWALGIGQSPNMFLIDGVARQGGGMGKHLGLNDNHVALTTEVMSRIQRAQLSDVTIDWGELDVAETYPARIPELWAGRPIMLVGRYRQPGSTTIHVNGKVEGEAVSWPLEVTFPDEQAEHDVLANVWARRKIEDLMHQSFYGTSPAVEEAVTALALDYSLMSAYTSFVAVDTSQPVQPAARPPRHMPIPVPLPEGTDWEGFFGPDGRPEEVDADALAAVEVTRSFSTNGPVAAGTLRAGYGLPATLPSAPGRGVAAANGGFGGGGFGGGGAAGPATGGGGVSWYYAPATRRARGRAPQQQWMLQRASGFDRFGRQDLSQQDARFEGRGEMSQNLYRLLLSNADGESTLAARAAEQFEAATAAREGGELEAARRMAVHAFLLDSAATFAGQSSGQTLVNAERLLTDVHQQRLETWTEQHPRLAQRLDLVLRNVSVSDALEQIAAQSGIQVSLVPGSLDDVFELHSQFARHVDYLDLQHATVAQGLEWLLAPRSLTWVADGDGVVTVRSDRRDSAPTAWIYDVSLLLKPTDQEISELANSDGFMERIAAEQASFLELAAAAVSQAQIVWYAPGQMLVVGSAVEHEQMAELLDRVAKAGEPLGEDWASFAETLRQRYRTNLEALEETRARRRVALTRARHARFAWQLLSSAVSGTVDDEAATQLMIAWEDDASGELLSEASRMDVCRSLWVVVKAAELLPGEERLQQLAQRARRRAIESEPASESTQRADATTYLTEWYYNAAISPDDMPIVPLPDADLEPALQLAMSVTRQLQSPELPWDAASTVALAADVANSDDLILLTALACAQSGDQNWQHFRIRVLSRLGQRPIAGSIVVLLHRLDGSGLARL